MEEMKGNATVVTAAINQNGLALEYASREMQNNKHIVMAAVQQNGDALQYASEEMKNDPTVLIAAFRRMGIALTVDESKDNETLMASAMRKCQEHGGKNVRNIFKNLIPKNMHRNERIREAAGWPLW